MRVLVTGGYGFIGSAVLTRLHRESHELVGAGRSLTQARLRFPHVRWIHADYDQLTTPAAWLPLLREIDAVVNCVGVFQDSLRENTRRVQVEATCALFGACAQLGIRRIIHFSAAGVSPAAPTAFMRTKAEADDYLSGCDLDWLILRPGLVLAPAAYGGTALLRGLAAVPWRTPLIGADARVQVVGLEDIAETVAGGLSDSGLAREAWDLVHPQVLTLGELVMALRQWLGFAPQRVMRLPAWAGKLVGAAADALGWLGWRSPARSTGLAQLAIGIAGDPSNWLRRTGIQPRSLADILARHPASVQERWFARLFFLKTVAFALLALFWLGSGIVSLGPGWNQGKNLLTSAGLSPGGAAATIVAGAVLDIALGAAVLVQPLARWVLKLMLVVSLVYLLVGSAVAPQLWADPLGSLVKTVFIMLSSLFALAILDER
jgi:uncharacterized protein YbjT (DUF2867 family)